jgi:hypothetical protein
MDENSFSKLGVIGFKSPAVASSRFLSDACPRYRNAESDVYSIWIVTPEAYPFSRCFEDLAFALQCGFRNLGFRVPVVIRPELAEGTVIVLGSHLISRINQNSLPQRMVLFNLEQVYADSPWMTPEYIQVATTHLLWDYSRSNVLKWEEIGVQCNGVCEVGFVQELERIQSLATRDVDVTFIGSLNDRRKAVLDELNNQNINVYWLFDVWGQQRDDVIGRSKILLNLHMYDAHVFEIVRVSYLLANACCVVSETGVDIETEESLAPGIAFSRHDQLVSKCIELLANDREQARLRVDGRSLIAQRDQTQMLKRALEQCGLAVTPSQ